MHESVSKSAGQPGGESELGAVGGSDGETECIKIRFPDLQGQAGFSLGNQKVVGGNAVGKLHLQMVPACPLVAGGCDDGNPPLSGKAVQICFQKGVSIMASVVISVAQVDGGRHFQLYSLFQDKICTLHNLSGAGKSVTGASGNCLQTQAHSNNAALVGDSPVSVPCRTPAVSRCDAGDGSPVSGAAFGNGNLGQSARTQRPKRLVQLLLGVDSSGILVQKIKDTAGSLRGAKSGMGIVYTGINDSHDNPLSAQGRGNAGGLPDTGADCAVVHGKKIVFAFFNKKNTGFLGKGGKLGLGYAPGGISVSKELVILHIFRDKVRVVPGIAEYDFIGIGCRIIARR